MLSGLPIESVSYLFVMAGLDPAIQGSKGAVHT